MIPVLSGYVDLKENDDEQFLKRCVGEYDPLLPEQKSLEFFDGSPRPIES